MIEFTCDKCGQGLQMPETYAGKKCRCPDCKTVLTVPSPVLFEFEADSQDTNPPDFSQTNKYTSIHLHDSALDFKPKPDITQDKPSFDSAIEQENTVPFADEKESLSAEQESRRKRPAIIEIFLYPTSIHGLTIIGILVGIPFLIGLLAFLAGPLAFFITIPGFFVLLILAAYTLWYFCQCIRESAEGEGRAPDVLINAPSLGDMGWQSLQVAVCLAFFTALPIIYNRYTGKVDTILYLLLAYTALFLPIGLLAVVLHDTITALNPILLIRSIAKTFFSYIKLVLPFYLVGWLVLFSSKLSSNLPYIFRFVIEAILIYLLMVMAHLLGRFYRTNSKKLDWET
jgi:phage FluMu protein Com